MTKRTCPASRRTASTFQPASIQLRACTWLVGEFVSFAHHSRYAVADGGGDASMIRSMAPNVSAHEVPRISCR